jgi:hypothetical protein
MKAKKKKIKIPKVTFEKFKRYQKGNVWILQTLLKKKLLYTLYIYFVFYKIYIYKYTYILLINGIFN